jgi:IS4 transposase
MRLDTDADTIYKAYSKRWEIEMVMRFYKSALEFDEDARA